MQVEVPFPVGSKVWLWAPSVGREPVQMIIETISIWMDKRQPDKIKFSFNFEQEPGDRRDIPDNVPIYASREEAVEFRELWIERAFPKANAVTD